MASRSSSGSRAKTEPPIGSPWDDPFAEASFCFVDLEMTGLRPETDRVIEICAERVRGGQTERRLLTLVKPPGGEFGNVQVHGIDPAELEPAPSFESLVPAIEEIMSGAILVAHAAAWDVAFLEAELGRAHRSINLTHYLDTLTLSRRAFALPSHRLSALCESFGITRVRQHRAEDDVAALRAVFAHITQVLSPRTPRDLFHVRVGQQHARPEVLAAAVNALEQASPVTIRYRPAHRPPEELVFMVTSVRTDLDPPRVLGYLLPSRGRRELRADRILAIAPSTGGAPSSPGKT